MTDLEQEAAWRTEFEADGERAVLDTICHGPGIYPDPKRSFAVRWLREREVERARQIVPTEGKEQVSPGPKSTGAPKFGDVADVCRTVDRLGSIERKIDVILKSHADVIRRLDALEEAQGGKAKR